MSDLDDKRIQAGIDQDPDSPEWTDDAFIKARPAAEVLPQIVKANKGGALKRRTRGSQKKPTKEPI